MNPYGLLLSSEIINKTKIDREGRFPMTYGCGTKEHINKKIVVTEEKVYGPNSQIVIGMWAEKDKYPIALSIDNWNYHFY